MGDGTPGILDGALIPPATAGTVGAFWTYRAPVMDGSHLLEGVGGGHVGLVLVGTAGNCGYAWFGTFGEW